MEELKTVEKHEDMFHMSQEKVRGYLSRLSQEDISPDEKAFKVLDEILPHSYTSEDKDENGETNWDMVYREIPRIYESDYEFGHALENYIGQNGFMVRPDIFLDTIISEHCLDKESFFVSDALHSLNYVYTFHRVEDFNNYFTKNLDFENPDNFERTDKILDLLSRVFSVGIANNSWSDTSIHLKDLLFDVVLKKKGSYLLYLKGRELLNQVYKLLDDDLFDIFIEEKSDSDHEYDNLSGVARMQIPKIVNKEFEIKIEELDEREQAFFMQFIKVKPANEIEQTKVFVNKYGKDGLRTFLSLQHNSGLGEKLVSFGNSNDEDIVKSIFKKYGEIIDASNQVLDYLKAEFSEEGSFSEEVVSEISDKLSKEGCSVLERFINGDLEKAKEILDSIKTDTLAFLSAFRTLKLSNSDFSLDDVKNLKLTTVPSVNIPKSDILAMENMYRSNYAKYPRLASFLTNKFEEAINQEGSSMSILRRNGEIVAFYRLGPTATEGILYFGSFNVDPTYQGALLGETLMQESLDVKAKDSVIIAECDPQVSVSANYIERGFIAIKKDHVEEIDILRIVRNDKVNERLASKNVSSEEIIANGIKDDKVHIYPIPTRDIPITSFDFVGKRKGDATEVLTRYIRDKKTGMTYFVTEDVEAEFLKEYSKL